MHWEDSLVAGSTRLPKRITQCLGRSQLGVLWNGKPSVVQGCTLCTSAEASHLLPGRLRKPKPSVPEPAVPCQRLPGAVCTHALLYSTLTLKLLRSHATAKAAHYKSARPVQSEQFSLPRLSKLPILQQRRCHQAPAVQKHAQPLATDLDPHARPVSAVGQPPGRSLQAP